MILFRSVSKRPRLNFQSRSVRHFTKLFQSNWLFPHVTNCNFIQLRLTTQGSYFLIIKPVQISTQCSVVFEETLHGKSKKPSLLSFLNECARLLVIAYTETVKFKSLNQCFYRIQPTTKKTAIRRNQCKLYVDYIRFF